MILPNSVTKIGREAFYATKTDINLTNYVEELHVGAFNNYKGGNGNRNVKSEYNSSVLVLPQGLEAVYQNSLGGGDNLAGNTTQGKSAFIIGSNDGYDPADISTLDITNLKTKFNILLSGGNVNNNDLNKDGIAGEHLVLDQSWGSGYAHTMFNGNASISPKTLIIGENLYGEQIDIQSDFMFHMHKVFTVVLPKGDVKVGKRAIYDNNTAGDNIQKLIIIQADDPAYLLNYDRECIAEKNRGAYIVFTNLTQAQAGNADCISGFKQYGKIYYKDTLTPEVINTITDYVGPNNMFPPVLDLLNAVITPPASRPAPPVHTPQNHRPYLAEAIWLNEKRKTV